MLGDGHARFLQKDRLVIELVCRSCICSSVNSFVVVTLAALVSNLGLRLARVGQDFHNRRPISLESGLNSRPNLFRRAGPDTCPTA